MAKSTNAIGIIPYDQPFQAGFLGNNGFTERTKGFSPIERTNKLRADFLDTELCVDAERAVLVTEAYQKFEDQPIILKRAKTLNHIAENVTIHTYDNEIIVGNPAAPNRNSGVYPEHSIQWIVDEMDNFPFEKREHDSYIITEENKQKLREIAPYWKGKSVFDRITASYSYDESKISAAGIGISLFNLYERAGIGHTIPDFEKVINVGYTGLIEEVQIKLDNLNRDDAKYIERRQQYEAMIITLNAAITYCKRYQKAYEEKAEQTNDEALKKEYLQIAKNLENISKGPATNFWEAIQLVHMTVCMIYMESNGHSLSYGRMDQYMYPFYKKDIENGTFTKEQIQEIIEAHYVKLGSPVKVRDRMTIISNSGRSWAGENITVGGLGLDGEDATNDLSFMYVDAIGHTRMMAPWSSVRYSSKTPYEFKRKVTEVIKSGCGHPKIFNDEVAIPSQLRTGRTLEEARGYALVGCVENQIPGKEFSWMDTCYINFAKIFELAINNGKCVNCSEACHLYQKCVVEGKGMGIETGYLKDFENIEQVKMAYEKQLSYILDLTMSCVNIMEVSHRDLVPIPFLTNLYEDAVQKGVDLSHGGAKYNHVGPQGSAIGTVADSLITIDQLMFKQKIATGEELIDALRNNWEGYEKLYHLVNSSKIPHYGNDDDYADAFATYVFDAYCERIERKHSIRGGIGKPGMYGVSVNIAFGILQGGATLDGRKAMEPVSDNMGAVHNKAAAHDIKGPTALSRSVAKFDHARATNGTLMNWKFTPESVSGETGTQNFINLMDSHFEEGGFHAQFNIMSSETMKAALESPEDYRDMLVRVAGYSAYFVELSKPLQLDLIDRTELSFE